MKKKLLAMVLSVLLLSVNMTAFAGNAAVKVEEISLRCDRTAIKTNEAVLLTARVSPQDASDPRVIFTSSDKKVAVVSDYGVVTGVSDGSAVITAAACDGSGIASSVKIVVKTTQALGFAFAHSDSKLLIGSPLKVQCVFDPAGATMDGLVWSSSNESVASVDQNGVVLGLQRGTATITALDKTGRLKQTCRVTVIRGPLAPLSDPGAPRYHFEQGVYKRYYESTEEKHTASIMLTGDIMSLNSQQSAARKGSTYDFNGSFALVRKLFEKADFVIGNLETNISYSRPITTERAHWDGNPHCNAPATLLDALRYAGYDAVATANNHCCDSGLDGLLETLEMLDRYRIAHTGTYGTSRTDRALQVNINGIRVAFLSYTEFFNRKSGYLTPAQQEAMLSPYSAQAVAKDVKAAKANGAEFVIAFNHGGTADTHSVNSAQIKHAQEMADAGVDLVINSHPHVLQRADMIQSKDGRKVLVVYSMGNFVASMPSSANKDTIILNVHLKKENGKVVMESAGYYPCKVIPDYKGNAYCVVPVSPQYNGGDRSTMLEATGKRIGKIMGSEIKLLP